MRLRSLNFAASNGLSVAVSIYYFALFATCKCVKPRKAEEEISRSGKTIIWSVLQGRKAEATSSVVESWKLTNYFLVDSVFRLAASSIVRKNDAGATFEEGRAIFLPPKLFPIPRFLTTDETRLRNVCDLLVSRL